ncbi:MAG: AAA-like domain-containing protein [Defluviitaleaceae bacterium]|nr:AAA-like domain-containing protein [Defluviitaleaceae bacterium]
MKKFNVTGTCVPNKHYMVDVTAKLEAIKVMIDDGDYFTINRGRQYGKTTTLSLLRNFLSADYTVISLSFEGVGKKVFADETSFCQMFLKRIFQALRFSGVSEAERGAWLSEDVYDFVTLGEHITYLCEEKKYVLLIDEVDKTSHNDVFLNFLSKLREKFLARQVEMDFTFHSVILAGVHDVRNIKEKLIQEGLYAPQLGETVIYNSPWNIAADFDVDLSFLAVEIETMLQAYEEDHATGMAIKDRAQDIYDYTGGYPVLVSRICKNIDEKLEKNWSVMGVRQAVKLILKEDSPLFQSLIKNLTSHTEFSNLVRKMIMEDLQFPFKLQDPFVATGVRFGFFKERESKVAIANPIFEMYLMDYFVNEKIRLDIKKNEKNEVIADQSMIIQDGKFNMEICMQKFSQYYHTHYSQKDLDFIEREARFFFIFFISPMINGKGLLTLESQDTDGYQRDIVVTYLEQVFVIELKIWRGEARQKKAYMQLLSYMDKINLKEGYLLTFDLRKQRETHHRWVTLDEKKILDVQV